MTVTATSHRSCAPESCVDSRQLCLGRWECRQQGARIGDQRLVRALLHRRTQHHACLATVRAIISTWVLLMEWHESRQPECRVRAADGGTSMASASGPDSHAVAASPVR